jgi:hypothetical protein
LTLGDPTTLALDANQSAVDSTRRSAALRNDQGDVWLWNARRTFLPGEPILHTTVANVLRPGPLALSENGRWLAVSDEHGSVTLIDAKTREPVGRIPLDRGAHADAAAVQSNGIVALAGNIDRATLTVWDLSFANLTRQACQIVARNLTRREWRRYVGAGTRYERPCPANP